MFPPHLPTRGGLAGRGRNRDRDASRGRFGRNDRTRDANVARQSHIQAGSDQAGSEPERSEQSPRMGASGPREQLTRTAQDLDRDARASFDEMRQVLKVQPPWSKEVEFCRQRSLQQSLLFHHPHHPLAQSLDPLWIQTSYSLIAAFRDQVSRAEAAVRPSPGPGGDQSMKRGTSVADQELKKVLTRFRQALASEEGFYRQLVIRLVRHFGLEESCRGAFVALALPVAPINLPTGSNVEGRTGNGSADRPVLGIEEKKEKVGLVYKALICLGDLERYKEQYSDAYRRDKAAVGEVNRKKGDESTERFNRARGYYDVARALVPDDGSAYNQLAVISTYLNEDFSVVYHYFRALAIRIPFKGVAEIVEKFLKKACDRWEQVEDGHVEGGADGPRAVELWKKEVVVLMAIIYRQTGFADIPSLKSTLLTNLSAFLRSRQLSSESIVQLTCISIGLHWHARSLASMYTSTSTLGGDSVAATAKAKKAARAQQTEEAAAEWLLCVFTVFLAVTASEIEAVMRNPGWNSVIEEAIVDDNDEIDVDGRTGGREKALHANISAVMRRLLPSLRIFSKWLKLHLDYLNRFATTPPPNVPPRPQSQLGITIGAFWSEYYRFIEAVARVFPLGMLPGMKNSGLEEDEDMRGFLPIARGLAVMRAPVAIAGGQDQNRAGSPSGLGNAPETPVHPNEEQLMRIGDLQVDATLILQAQTTGISITEDNALNRDQDETASLSAGTEDDPVNLAMRASLDQDAISSIDYDQYAFDTGDTTPSPAHDMMQHLSLGQTPAPGVVQSNQHQRDASTTSATAFANSALPTHQHGFQPWAATVPSPRGGQGFAPVMKTAPAPPLARPASGDRSRPGSGSGSPGLLFGNDNIWAMTREESTSQKGQRRDAQPPLIPAVPTTSAGVTGFGQAQTRSPGQGVSSGFSRAGQAAYPSANRLSSGGLAGEQSVKALWDTATTAGPVGSILGVPQKEVSQPGIVRSNPLDLPQGLDAAQLFAGISGLGNAGSPWNTGYNANERPGSFSQANSWTAANYGGGLGGTNRQFPGWKG